MKTADNERPQGRKIISTGTVEDNEPQVNFNKFGRTCYDIILRPLVSEKSVAGIKSKKYAFRVATDATKSEIKWAVEQVFDGVKVKSVNTVNYDGKIKRQGRYKGRESAWKKAYIQLSKDSKAIEFFESLQ